MVFLLIATLVACSTPSSEPSAAGHDHDAEAQEAHDHNPAEHGHAARHGGVQQEMTGGHIEALFEQGGVRFYLTDGDNQPLPATVATGTVVVTGPAGTVTRELVVQGDHLFADAPLEEGKAASAVLTVTRSGLTEILGFTAEGVGRSFHDHGAQHGGQVVMSGNYHVELLAADGRYRVWLTDASRGQITTGVTGAVIEGGQRLPLVAEADGGLAVASAGAGTGDVGVEITHEDQSFTVQFSSAGTADHAHMH